MKRVTKPETDIQETLFETGPPWKDHWWGMPAYVMGDATPEREIIVQFRCWEDAEKFAAALGVRVTRQTISFWYPQDVGEGRPSEWVYIDE